MLSDAFRDELAQEAFGIQARVVHDPAPQEIATAEAPTFPLGLGIDFVRLRGEVDDGLRFRGSFALQQCSDGFDPVAEPVSVLVSTPAGTFYPAAGSPDVFPIQPGEFELLVGPAGRRWRLTEAGRLRTGIERFEIDDRDGTVVFVDRNVILPDRPYDQLTVELTVGNEFARASATLVEAPCDSGRWILGR